jgi:hypothetical protein
MSIASELSRLQQAKSELATSIENKGVTVPAATTLDGYGALVDSIPSGVNLYDEMRDNMYVAVPYSVPFNTNYGFLYNFVYNKSYKITIKCRNAPAGKMSFFCYQGNANTPNAVVGALDAGQKIQEVYYTHSITTTYTRFGVWATNTNDRNQNFSCAVHIEEVNM